LAYRPITGNSLRVPPVTDNNRYKSECIANQGGIDINTSLYSRLGGYDAIARFATTLIGHAQEDDLLGRFWKNRGEDRNARELQVLIDYLVNQTGGQMYYTGRNMALAHQGMGITETDWARFIEITASVAATLGVGETEGHEVMTFLDSLKPDIVTP